VNSAIGLFYYLRFVVAMFKLPAADAGTEDSISIRKISLTDSTTLAALTVLLIWLGVYPSLFIDIIQMIG
jgi:NADH-quinone oxidoreductase subunit N